MLNRTKVKNPAPVQECGLPTNTGIDDGYHSQWQDHGKLWPSNSHVPSLIVYNGELYGSIADADRTEDKSHVFRFAGGKQWVDCGRPKPLDGAGCLLPFNGKLYCSSVFNIYEYQGGDEWKCVGEQPHGIEQIHSMTVLNGKLHIGTWPQGYALRYAGEKNWEIIGRLGLPVGMRECNEINALSVYNGKVYAGVIPKAEVYRREKDGDWTMLNQLAQRPDRKLATRSVLVV